ncbi:hypothetical protein AA13594_2804 [Gluconacetobacter azotocaptans DSM 13594]|nr:hypothetical protein AA13594_2804 [Gluconacetobacter azotocaptans DSM 13594]
MLMQLVELESNPMRFASVSDYRAHIAQHASLDRALIGALRAYGTDLIAGIQDRRALPLLRQEARVITRSRPFIGSPVAQGVVQAALDQAWDGVGGWRR